MTKKDFELIASVFANCEELLEATADPQGIGPSTLRIVVNQMSGALKQTNPRFNAGTFEKASLPRQSERMKNAILAKLNPQASR